MISFRPIAALAVVTAAVLLPTSSSVGVGATQITVSNYMYMSMNATAPLGGTVTWRFPDSVTHTATSNQGFFDSGNKANGDTFAYTFTSAGTYDYLCTIHTFMTATVAVPVVAVGTPARGYKLTWATTSGAGTTAYDVQVRVPGSKSFKAFLTHTTKPSTTFNPSKAGAYVVRARTDLGSKSTGWSAAKKITIS